MSPPQGAHAFVLLRPGLYGGESVTGSCACRLWTRSRSIGAPDASTAEGDFRRAHAAHVAEVEEELADRAKSLEAGLTPPDRLRSKEPSPIRYGARPAAQPRLLDRGFTVLYIQAESGERVAYPSGYPCSPGARPRRLERDAVD